MRVLGQKKTLLTLNSLFFYLFYWQQHFCIFFREISRKSVLQKQKNRKFFYEILHRFLFFLAKFLFTKMLNFVCFVKYKRIFSQKLSFAGNPKNNTVQRNVIFFCLSIFIFSSFQVLLEIKAEMLNISCQGKTLNSATLSKKF